MKDKINIRKIGYKIILLIILMALATSSTTTAAHINKEISSTNRIYMGNHKKASEDDLQEEKVVYLTFDDGPSYEITAKLLDVLRDHNVKATFFVVGKEIKGKEVILRRIYDEGHGIGLHTYTHNFKYIYESNENFMKEMKKTCYMIEDILGITPKAIRFPGGSAGVLDEELLSALHENNFKIYDWNVDLHDGVNAAFSPEKLIKYAKKAKGNQNERIILAHCNYNNKNTCKALDGIIQYYKENGFTFKVIDDNTKEYHYKLKK